MKKTAIAAATTFAALSTMLIAPAAHAEPYPRSIDTTAVAVADDLTVNPVDYVRVKFKWNSEGTADPVGRVIWKVVNERTGVIVKRGDFWDGRDDLVTRVRFTLQRGNYRVFFRTRTGENSVFQNARALTDVIKVRKRF